MRRTKWRRWALLSTLASGCLFAGPCGITTLQLQDFLTSTAIRTGVSTLATVIDAAIIGAATGDNAD